MEDHQWESRYTFFSKDFKLDFDYFLYYTQYQCLRNGKLIIWSELIDGWLFCYIKSKTFETIEVADSNFSISLFPYEESLASKCSMNDILTANCLEVEANVP